MTSCKLDETKDICKRTGNKLRLQPGGKGAIEQRKHRIVQGIEDIIGEKKTCRAIGMQEAHDIAAPGRVRRCHSYYSGSSSDVGGKCRRWLRWHQRSTNLLLLQVPRE